MRDYRNAKAMAQSLRQALSEKSIAVTHSDALELIAKSFGLDNWNILAAKIDVPVLSEAVEPAAQPAGSGSAGGRQTLYCSFCGKSQHDVVKLIAGPNSFICDECVGLCVAIVEETDTHSLMQKDRASGAQDYPGFTAFLRGRSREQLDKMAADTERAMSHLLWSMQAIAHELGEPVAAPVEPPTARASRPPLAGKTPAVMRAMKADFERRLDDCRMALEIAARVRAETEAG